MKVKELIEKYEKDLFRFYFTIEFRYCNNFLKEITFTDIEVLEKEDLMNGIINNWFIVNDKKIVIDLIKENK